MRLIDADWVLGALGVFNDRKHGDAHFFNGIASAEEIIENAPTIESPRSGWTPCSEGVPVPHHKGQQREMFLVSLETGCVSTMFYEFNPNGYLGEGWSDKILTVIAWQPLPEPYNPDHIVDTNKKVDQFREPTKMISEEPTPCKVCGCNYVITWERHCVTPHRFYCQCAKCKQKTREHENKELAKQEWNKIQEERQ